MSLCSRASNLLYLSLMLAGRGAAALGHGILPADGGVAVALVVARRRGWR